MGENVHRRVKRRLLWPTDLTLVEHALAHDVGTGTLEGVANHIVVDRTGLTPGAKLELLAEVRLD